MRQIALFVVSVFLLGTSASAWSCSMVGSHKLVYLESPSLSGDKPDAPIIKSHFIKRGLQKDVWDCTHFGTFTLILPTKLSDDIVGFRFSTSEGRSPFYVGDAILAPVQIEENKYGYVFPWPDIGKDKIGGYPIDFVLSISQVSRNGVVGPSLRIRIEHPGT